MAKPASKDQIAADIEGPNYNKALDLLRNRVVAKKSKVAEVNGEISGIYDQIDKMGVNKVGARMFLALDGKEDAERKDILRTIMKLSELAGWNKGGDLMDQAEGTNIVEMPRPAGSGDDGDGEELDPAGFKAVVVERIAEESDLAEADAYVIANTIYDSLTTAEKSSLTRTLAMAKADEEMEDWEADEAKPS